jgi:UDP-N-acetylmuramoyl-tripeptide--D-alanyl-D-alanine ligase
VTDPLVALGALGAYHRRRWGGRVVAVAGSAGKTTTRSVISRLLESLFPGRVHATLGNLNNRVGVPLTLLGLGPQHDLGVVEVGTNLPGEVRLLGDMASADVAVLTLIDLEHTEGLGDLEGVAREEGAIFASLPAGGVAIGNADDELVRGQLQRYPGRRLGYGEGGHAELVIRERRLLAPGRTALRLEYAARSWSFETSLSGLPGALAIAAGVLVCETVAPGQLEQANLEGALTAGAEPGRSSILRLSQGRIVLDDTYNSNPASARQAIATGQELAQMTGGRLWLVLGEMKELGALSAAEHEALGALAATSAAEGLYTVGAEAERTMKAASAAGLRSWHAADAASVGTELWPRLSPNDVVVVKASRGVRAERIVQALVDADKRTNPAKAKS